MCNKGVRKMTNCEKCIDLQVDSALSVPAIQRSMPVFSYFVPKIGVRRFGTINVDKEVVYLIEDMNDFYAAMGCDKKARESGVLDEEFIWYRYMRDGAEMSKSCLQVRIATYLKKNSPEFMWHYQKAYEAMTEQCINSLNLIK